MATSSTAAPESPPKSRRNSAAPNADPSSQAYPVPDDEVESWIPLSVSTAVIGLIASSIQTHNDALDILQEIGHPPQEHLARVSAALKSFKPTIQLIYKFLRRVELSKLLLENRPALVSLDVLICTLAEAALAISDVGFTLNDVVHAVQAGEETKLTTSAARHGTRLMEGKKRIERTELIMSKVLIVLQINSDTEATQQLLRIEALVDEILDTNTTLSESLSTMSDIFSARSLVPQARLDNALNTAPPIYSRPLRCRQSSDTLPTLPDYTERTASGTHLDGSVTIRATSRSVFTGLSLADVRVLSLLPLPVVPGELRDGPRFYTAAYARSVDAALGELAERNSHRKNSPLVQILGLRAVGSATESNSFARSVQGGRRLIRVQPNMAY